MSKMTAGQLTLPLAAALAAAMVSPAPAESFGLRGPFLYHANARSSNLVVADLNGDGLLDIASVANDESVLKLLYQTRDEQAEDPFRAEEITLNRLVRCAVAVDVDGDDRTDLVMATPPSGLSVMYQTAEGRLQKGQELDIKADYISLGNLDGDDHPDLLVAAGSRFEILPGKARGIELDPSAEFFTTGEPTSPPMILDVDGDGLNDIVYHPGAKPEQLVIRLQAKSGGFPAEFWMDMGPMRSVDALETPRGKDLFAAVHANTHDLLLLELAEPLEEDADALSLSDPRLIGFDPETRDDKSFSTAADVDGDGRMDLLVAMPESASVRLVRHTRGGALEPRVAPCLKDLRQILPWPADRGEVAHLLLLSGEEKMIGVARVDERNPDTLKFPQPLPLKARPLAMGLFGTADKGGTPSLAVVEANADGAIALMAYPGFQPDSSALPEAQVLFSMESGAEEPTGMAVVDLNLDERDDIVLFFKFEKPMPLLQGADGKFQRLEASGVLAGLLDGTDPARLFRTRLDDEKQDTVLVVKQNYVRAFHLEEGGEVSIASQFNAATNRSRLKTAVVANLQGERAGNLALLDTAGKEVTIYGFSEGAPELLRSVKLDDAAYNGIVALDLDDDGRDELVLTAPDRITVYHSQVLNGELQTIDSHAAENEEEGGYGLVRTLNLRAGSPAQIAAVEMKDHLLEFFAIEPSEKAEDEGAIRKYYGFKVFDAEAMISRSGQEFNMPAEPREMVSADLNGDGARDLVVLIHDKMAVYYQKQ